MDTRFVHPRRRLILVLGRLRQMRLAFSLTCLVVTTAYVAEELFTRFGNATVCAIKHFGSGRKHTRLGQDYLEESAKVAIEYAALVGSRSRALPGTVSSIA